MSKEQVILEALRLPLKERAEVVNELMASLDNLSQQESDALWIEVAVNRYEELKSGKVKGVPIEEVLRDVRTRAE
jgi:putative addiction module component (TIGR02574 family)